MLSKQCGFSELLIVAAIVVISAAIAIPNLLCSHIAPRETPAVVSRRIDDAAAVRCPVRKSLATQDESVAIANMAQ